MSELCKTCKVEVSSISQVCPQCGMKFNKVSMVMKTIIALCGAIVVIGIIAFMLRTPTKSTDVSPVQSKITFGTGRNGVNLTGIGSTFDVNQIYARLETKGGFNTSKLHLMINKVSETGATRIIYEDMPSVSPQDGVLSFAYTFDEPGKYRFTILNNKTDEILGESDVIIK